jgi:hypothetical protein
MSFSYPTVTINAVAYPVYGDLADADNYLMASITATAWFAAAAFVRMQSIVSVVRWMDRVPWLGAQTESDNALQFPRTGLTNADGTPVDSNSLPLLLVNAEFELAAMLVDNPDLQSTFQDPRAKALGAGSARIDYFRPVGQGGNTDVQVLSPLPVIIMGYVGQWISGQSPASSVQAKGTKSKSRIGRTDEWGYVHGY